VDIVLLAGITLATQRGYEAERQILVALTERLKRPVFSVMSANVGALKHAHANKIVIATAYLERINLALRRYFEDAGFEVLGMKGLDVSRPVEQAKLPEDASYQVARGLFAEHPDADAVLIHGRWNSLAHVEKLEREIGRPVVSSVAASLWWIIRTLRIDLKIAGYGRILTVA
jgi:maleate cis-trans isomerase